VSGNPLAASQAAHEARMRRRAERKQEAEVAKQASKEEKERLAFDRLMNSKVREREPLG